MLQEWGWKRYSTVLEMSLNFLHPKLATLIVCAKLSLASSPCKEYVPIVIADMAEKWIVGNANHV